MPLHTPQSAMPGECVGEKKGAIAMLVDSVYAQEVQIDKLIRIVMKLDRKLNGESADESSGGTESPAPAHSLKLAYDLTNDNNLKLGMVTERLRAIVLDL